MDTHDDDTGEQSAGSGDAGHTGSPNQATPNLAKDYWNRRLSEYLTERQRRLEEARAPVAGVVSYGASNFPHDPTIWSPDWRDSLPPRDPRRENGPAIVKSGTPQAYEKIAAAYRQIRNAYEIDADSNDSDGDRKDRDESS